jgi:hypothetical protein
MTIDDYEAAYDLWIRCGNAFWESQGFTLREDLNYRNKALAELIRIDPEYVK